MPEYSARLPFLKCAVGQCSSVDGNGTDKTLANYCRHFINRN
jgi:hypothetical protein